MQDTAVTVKTCRCKLSSRFDERKKGCLEKMECWSKVLKIGKFSGKCNHDLHLMGSNSGFSPDVLINHWADELHKELNYIINEIFTSC